MQHYAERFVSDLRHIIVIQFRTSVLVGYARVSKSDICIVAGYNRHSIPNICINRL
jgi:hypothetical protein